MANSPSLPTHAVPVPVEQIVFRQSVADEFDFDSDDSEAVAEEVEEPNSTSDSDSDSDSDLDSDSDSDSTTTSESEPGLPDSHSEASIRSHQQHEIVFGSLSAHANGVPSSSTSLAGTSTSTCGPVVVVELGESLESCTSRKSKTEMEKSTRPRTKGATRYVRSQCSQHRGCHLCVQFHANANANARALMPMTMPMPMLECKHQLRHYQTIW